MQIADTIVARLHRHARSTFPAGAATAEATAMVIDGARQLGYCFGVVDNSGQVIGDRYASTGETIPPVPYSLPPAFGTMDQLPMSEQ